MASAAAGEPLGDLPGLALGLFLLQGVDPLDGREDPDFLAMMLHGLDAEGGRDVRFAGAWTADQHSVAGTIQELTTVQLAPRSISVASLISLAAQSKPDRSLQAGKRAAFM